MIVQATYDGVLVPVGTRVFVSRFSRGRPGRRVGITLFYEIHLSKPEPRFFRPGSFRQYDPIGYGTVIDARPFDPRNPCIGYHHDVRLDHDAALAASFAPAWAAI